MGTVIFEELKTQSEYRIARATLSSPKTLNAADLEMLQALRTQFLIWMDDPLILLIFLQGEGEKAFCAGGNLLRLYDSMKNLHFDQAEAFFREIYGLDFLLRKSNKPILVWGQGIVMGGGMGFFMAGTFRIATENSRIAMPEIQIGFFPDVGASFFLSRIPHKIGLFIGLTSSHLNAQDALDLGLATHTLSHSQKQILLDQFVRQKWTGGQEQRKAEISNILDGLSQSFGNGHYLTHAQTIQSVMDFDSVPKIGAALKEASNTLDWFKKPSQLFEKGSPTAKEIFYEQYKRGSEWSIEESFSQEYKLASYMIREPDFLEGIRALLVEKDGIPKWSQLNECRLKTFFRTLNTV